MGKSKSDSIFKRIWSNIYFRNISLMILVLVALTFITLLGLNIYTRHGSYVEVPDLVGLQEQEAVAVIVAAGLKYEVVDSLYDEKGVPGSVLDQVPNANLKVKPGRFLFLKLKAKSPQMIAVPDVEDISARQAEALLSAVGLTNVKREVVDSEFRDLAISLSSKGKVLKPGEKVAKGSLLTLRVGSGSLQNNDSDIIMDSPIIPLPDDDIEEIVE